MSIRRSLLGVLGICVLVLSARADNWPQWRGPERNGISKETGLLKQWPNGGPKLVWQATDIGGGYSTPSVVGDRLYLLSNKGMKDEFVEARGALDGKPIWNVTIGKVGPNTKMANYPAARSTPTIDGDALYALGSDGDLVCLNAANGTLRWRKSLRTDFGGQPGKWAYSESPLIDGDVLVCTPGGSEATMLALNKNTGEVVWKSAIPGGDKAAYSSVIGIDVGGVKQYVQFLEKGVVGIDAKTGNFLWRYEKTAQGSPANIPTPTVHDGFIYTATGFGGGGLIELKAGSGSFTAKPVYSGKKLPNAIGGTIELGGYLYGTGGQGMQCVEFTTGTLKWQSRGIGTGSLCYADGRLYLHGENGQVALVEPSPESYREKGRFTPPNPPSKHAGKAWCYPVVADGRLYIRDWDSLWCYDVREQVAAN